MIIFIVGNMASGKSSISKELTKKLKGFKHLELDEFRKKHNPNRTLAGDNKAQMELVEAIKNNKNVIVESTGTGRWYDQYFRHDKHNKIQVVLLDSTLTLCRERQKKRLSEGYEMPPIPSSWSLTFESSLKWMQDKLKYIKKDLKISAKDSIEENVEKITKFLSL